MFWFIRYRVDYLLHRSDPESYHALHPQAKTWWEFFMGARTCVYCRPPAKATRSRLMGKPGNEGIGPASGAAIMFVVLAALIAIAIWVGVLRFHLPGRGWWPP